MAADVLDRLLDSEEPSVRYKVRVQLLGEDPSARKIRELREEIRSSRRVRALLSERTKDGTISRHPYQKWDGAHWVLAMLSDTGYPQGGQSFIPLREQVYDWLLSDRHRARIQTINGRVRRCASQEGSALLAILSLGIDDERCDELALRLMKWQWPDGGWNCDKRPEAINSSFHESLIPMRALATYGRMRNDREATASARRAAEVFLKRRLFRGQRDGAVIDPSFLRLAYPPFWFYNILHALRAIAEMGMLGNPRCSEALEVLASKQLPDGGFPAEVRHYRVDDKQPKTGKRISRRCAVDWGASGKLRLNEFVTVDAIYVLSEAVKQGARTKRGVS
jgi:hypothetical protein